MINIFPSVLNWRVLTSGSVQRGRSRKWVRYPEYQSIDIVCAKGAVLKLKWTYNRQVPEQRERMDNNRRKLSFLGFNPSRVSIELSQMTWFSAFASLELWLVRIWLSRLIQMCNRILIIIIPLSFNWSWKIHIYLCNDPTLSVLTKKCNSIDI